MGWQRVGDDLATEQQLNIVDERIQQKGPWVQFDIQNPNIHYLSVSIQCPPIEGVCHTGPSCLNGNSD